jgi:hypothetical protein
MVNPVPIQFGPWEPDRAPHMSPSLSEATNVLPVAGAYAPFPTIVPSVGTALPAPAKGFFSIPLADGAPLVYGATNDDIYQIGNGFTARRFDGTGLSPGYWRFAQFDGRTIAINPSVNPKGAVPGGDFTDLGGTPPKAVTCGVVNNFLVLGNLISDGVDGYQPNRIRWSGFNDPDTWGTNVGTQADFQPMPDEGGPVIAVTGREIGTVFQRKCISRMQYVGTPNVFDFQVVESGRGAISTGSVCDIGNLVFFLADDGFYVWDGASATPIGTDRVDRWFNSMLDHNRVDDIISGFDPVTRCVLWGFPRPAMPGIQTIIAFSIGDQRWTSIEYPIQALGASQSLPTTLEDMPAPDTFGGSFDDPAFAGKAPVLAGIDGNNTYGTFSGGALPATLTTGDYQSSPGSRSFVTSVRPIVDSSGVTIAVGERDQTTANVVMWKDPVSLNRAGTTPQRNDGRYLRYKLEIPANDSWNRAVGLEVELKGTGRR